MKKNSLILLFSFLGAFFLFGCIEQPKTPINSISCSCPEKISKQDALNKGYVSVSAEGESMSGVCGNEFSGNVWVTQNIVSQDLKVCDVVIASDGSRIVMHRIVEKGEDYFLLKGDASKYPDYYLPEPNLTDKDIVVELDLVKYPFDSVEGVVVGYE